MHLFAARRKTINSKKWYSQLKLKGELARCYWVNVTVIHDLAIG